MKKGIEYISKRLVVRGTEKAFKTAANKAIKKNGYVIVVKDEWLVKEFLNGNIERIKRIDSSGISQELLLD
jgi:hypothetical protein